MTLEELRSSVVRSRWLAAVVILGTFAAYLGYFALAINAPRSTDPASWGQFGDYIGGILNPVIALFAFYWLTQSI
jgi:hypothetical protein